VYLSPYFSHIFVSAESKSFQDNRIVVSVVVMAPTRLLFVNVRKLLLETFFVAEKSDSVYIT